MRKVIYIFILCFFLCSCVTNHYTEEDFNSRKKQVSPTAGAIAGIIPGLPQFVNGETVEGIIYSSLVLGGFIAGFSLSPFDDTDTTATICASTIVLAYIYSFIDGVISTSVREKEYETFQKNETTRINKERAEQRAIERELRLSKFTEKERDAIENEQFFLGMSRLALIESIGEPDDINETVGSWGVHEQFVYSSYDLYVYLENGIVTSWQK